MIFKRSFPISRRSHRQWINTSVQVFTPLAHMDALGINLSEGGMCFFSVADLHIGSHVDIEFKPADSEQPVRVTAEIRHRALYLYGVEFLGEIELPRPDARPSAALPGSHPSA